MTDSNEFESRGSRYTTNGNGYYFCDGKRIKKNEYYGAKYTWERESAGTKGRNKSTSRDVGGTRLTPGQEDILVAIMECPMGDGSGNTWCDTLTEYASIKLKRSPMSVGALISTICEKGLAVRDRTMRECGDGKSRKCVSISLTALGRDVVRSLHDTQDTSKLSKGDEQ